MSDTVKIKLLHDNGGFVSGDIIEATHRYASEYEFINVWDAKDSVWVVEDEANPTRETWAGVIVEKVVDVDSRSYEYHTVNLNPTKNSADTVSRLLSDFDSPVEHPTHYNVVEGMPEVWDILDAFFPDEPDLWNAGKYLLRAGRKNSKVEDLKKLVQYAQRAIEKEELHG